MPGRKQRVRLFRDLTQSRDCDRHVRVPSRNRLTPELARAQLSQGPSQYDKSGLRIWHMSTKIIRPIGLGLRSVGVFMPLGSLARIGRSAAARCTRFRCQQSAEP